MLWAIHHSPRFYRLSQAEGSPEIKVHGEATARTMDTRGGMIDWTYGMVRTKLPQ